MGYSDHIMLPLKSDSEITANLTGNILNIHRLIAHSPELINASAEMRNYLVRDSALTERQRELLILRTGHLAQSAYEWAHHVVRGRAAGLSDEEINRVKGGGMMPEWTAQERALLNLVDEMQGKQQLSAETTTTLLAEISPAGVIDAVFTVGYYLTLGTLLNTFDVPIDENITPLA